MSSYNAGKKWQKCRRRYTQAFFNTSSRFATSQNAAEVNGHTLDAIQQVIHYPLENGGTGSHLKHQAGETPCVCSWSNIVLIPKTSRPPLITGWFLPSCVNDLSLKGL